MDQQTRESKSKLKWVILLTILAMSVTIGLVTSLIIGLGALSWLVAPLLLRGTVITAWFSGFILIAAVLAALSIKSSKTYRTLLTTLLVLSTVFAIATLVAGVDVSRVFASPTTLTGHLGDAFSKVISNSRLAPKGMRNPGGETIVSSITRLTASIAVMQLIGFLPFPYNLILFLMYYKFVTVLIVALIPLSFAVWSIFQVYSARNDVVEPEEDSLEASSEEGYGTFEKVKQVDEERARLPTLRTPPHASGLGVQGAAGWTPRPNPPPLSPATTFYQG